MNPIDLNGVFRPNLTRREFLRQTSLATVGVAGAASLVRAESNPLDGANGANDLPSGAAEAAQVRQAYHQMP
jgi:hypothetical protein